METLTATVRERESQIEQLLDLAYDIEQRLSDAHKLFSEVLDEALVSAISKSESVEIIDVLSTLTARSTNVVKDLERLTELDAISSFNFDNCLESCEIDLDVLQDDVSIELPRIQEAITRINERLRQVEGVLKMVVI